MKDRTIIFLLLFFCLQGILLAAEPSLLENTQAIRHQLEKRIEDSQTPLAERGELLLRLGKFAEFEVLLPRLQNDAPANARELEEQFLMQTYRFAEAQRAFADHASLKFAPTTTMEINRYRWLFLREDLPAVDSLSTMKLRRDSTNAVAWWAHGEESLKRLKFNDAQSGFEKALKLSNHLKLRALSRIGLSKVFSQLEQHQSALDTLLPLWETATLNAEVLYQTSLVLIRLGRVSEATDLLDECLQWNSFSESAHYMEGNGYARYNYTQLVQKYPVELNDSLTNLHISKSLDCFARGAVDSARKITEAVLRDYPTYARGWVVKGSLEWNMQHFDSAADCFRHALNLIPEYGRAHNGLAKSLEGLRMQWNINRMQDSVVFAAKPVPSIPGIEEFVINWASLSERHRKQVALALAPWKGYLPVLLECGSRYYIKPLHEKLSEGPGLANMKDQRISYDSRLWDDVRGCGGFTTVTGIEDVERSIYFNYNTVLHELTHQVHGVFPPDDAQRITDQWHAALTRDKTTPTLLSRYQSASVWEYFAEGTNAYFSPQRNAFDTREETYERLVAMDTALAHLVETYIPAPNLEKCYAVGLVNAAGDALEKPDVPRAMTMIQRAQLREPHAQNVLSMLSYLYSLQDSDRLAIAYAETLVTRFPKKADSYTTLERALFFRDGATPEGWDVLNRGLLHVDSTEREAMENAAGQSCWFRGKYAEARKHFQAVLKQVQDDPSALWGLGEAWGDDHRFAEADNAFQKALLKRSGIVDLRLDYARILLLADRVSDAGLQIAEAAHLEPDNEDVLCYQGWLAARKGHWEDALNFYNHALSTAPYLRLTALLKVDALRHLGKNDQAAMLMTELRAQQKNDLPEYIFHRRKSAFITIKTWPRFQSDLLQTLQLQ